MTFRAEAAGLPRWTVMFFGMMTRSSTRGTQARDGVGPLPPSPVNSECSGMTGRVYHVAILFGLRDHLRLGQCDLPGKDLHTLNAHGAEACL